MLDVKLDKRDPLPLYDQVCAEIRRAIADGEIGPGERLPPARDLAAVLQVNTNTVLRALRLLRDEGLLEFRRGRGVTVGRLRPAGRGPGPRPRPGPVLDASTATIARSSSASSKTLPTDRKPALSWRPGRGRAPRVVRYPAAGTANVDVTLWIAALDGSRVQARWDRDAFEYVPGAGWDAYGPYAVEQSRDQLTVRFLGIDPATARHRPVRTARRVLGAAGSGLPRPHRLRRGGVPSDLDGTRYLTVDGTPVTPGLQVQAVLGVDGDEVLFTASAEPTETHLWTYGRATASGS